MNVSARKGCVYVVISMQDISVDAYAIVMQDIQPARISNYDIV